MNKYFSPYRIFWISLLISLAAEFFIIYIIYFSPEKISPLYSPGLQMWVSAFMNFLSALSLFISIIFIKKNLRNLHIFYIRLALLFSSLFLINYIFYHLSVGHIIFTNLEYRTLYLCILASHLFCSLIGLPMIFTTYALGEFKHFKLHKKLAPSTFFIWEYISLSGVVIVLMLKFCNNL